MAEQLEFYFPKTKSKHMAMPTTGKKYPSKGGTVRFGVQASMNGSMSLPKYVKEEEFYDYGFGKINPSYKYPQEFIDAHYHMDSNPMLTGDDSNETVELAYQAWYQKQAENEVLNAEVSVGEKQITNRKDYDIDNELSGFSNMEVGDIDLEDYEDEITASVEDEVIEAIRESVDDNMPISDGESVSSYVNVDTELEITVPISGDIDYDWTANENYDENEDEWNAETGLEAITEPEVFGGSNYAVKMIKNAQNHLKMVREAESFEAPYGGIGSLFGIGGDTEIGGFSTSELTGSSAIHGDFDSASLNYSGHQNLQVRAETEKVCKFEGCGDMYSPEWYSDDYCTTACANDMIICGKNKPFLETFMGRQRMNEHWNDGAYGDFCQSLTEDVDGMEMCNDCDYQQVDYGADTVGNPSPSSPLDEVPATVPSPAEPTNESYSAEEDVVCDSCRGVDDTEADYVCADCENDICYNHMKLWPQPNKYDFGEHKPLHLCLECYQENWNLFLKTGKQPLDLLNAEMDELSEDTSIIRNRVGDMVGMVELDENDEDIEKVDVDIIDDDGEMAYEGTLGAETFNMEGVYISGIKDDKRESQLHIVGDEDADGFTPKEISDFDTNKLTPYETNLSKRLSNNHDAETFESQGTNTKMILGITALAVGLGLWKGKEIMSISEKITESIKNMRK